MTENSRFIRVPLLAALMGLLVSLTAPSHAATWYVRPDGGIGSGTSWGDARRNVQSVISYAKAGDEIWVASGVYRQSITLKAGIDLYGGFAGMETAREDRDFAANPTILDATGLNQRVITADGTNGVTIDGFTIRNGNSPASGGGIYFNNVSSATVSNCVISANTATRSLSHGGGVYCSASSPTLTNCTISGNTATSDGGGVYCSSSSPTLSKCTISGNTADRFGGGVGCVSSSSPLLSHCTISDNTAPGSGGGIYFSDSSSKPTLTNCILWNPGNEISMGSGVPVVRYSCVQEGYPGEGNIDAYPQFADPLNGDWRLRDGSPCIDRGADIGLPFNGAGPDMGSWEAPEDYLQGPPDHLPQLFRVDHTAPPGGDGLSWNTAFRSVGEALFFSSDSDEIWVAAGTYNESITMNNGLALYGGFAAVEKAREERDSAANPTILDATGLNQRVITAVQSEGVTIDGFTIRNGNLGGGGGGGILFSNVSSATVSYCTITNNTIISSFGSSSVALGAGVYCSSSSPTLTHCTISNNTVSTFTSPGGAGIFCTSSSPTLIACTISGNTAGFPGDGGGVYCRSSSPILSNCTISGNTAGGSGGGLDVSGFSSSPILSNCTISGNRAGGSGGGLEVSGSSSSPTLTRCTISGNRANWGGGVSLSDSSPTLTHCTITDNTTDRYSGAVTCYDSSPTLTNCLLWNPGMEIHVQSGAPVVRFSCVQGGDPGEDNINAYPHFVDPLNGDWRLRDGSPCIDRGVDVGLPYNGTSPDMGAWEAPEPYSQGPPDPLPQRFHVAAGAAKGGDGLTWETAFSSVGEAVLHSSTAVEIWVSAGIYNESIHMENGLALYGGFTGTETSREGRNVSLNHTVLYATGYDQPGITVDRVEGVTIDGFTIRTENPIGSGRGLSFYRVSSATVSHCTISGDITGGGVECESSSPTLIHCTISENTASFGAGLYLSSSSPTLIHCTISGNTAFSQGGGVFCSESSSPTLINCTIASNTAYSTHRPCYGGGVYCSRSSSPTLINCTITNNTADYGGGVVSYPSSTPILTHCTISGNTATRNGGGVHCTDSSSTTLTDCTITGNTAASGGGVFCERSSLTLSKCAISGNTAKIDGGGVYCYDFSSPTLNNCRVTANKARYDAGGVYCLRSSSPSLTHCTIAANTANRDGAGVASFLSSSPTLINCILWNEADEVFVNSATAEVTFSAIQGGYPGEGNIDEDPMFVDPEQSDYRLAMGSPCIDSGSTGAVLRLGPSLLAMGDHDGRMRIWDGDGDGIAAADMGAYEFGPPPFVGDVFGDARVNHLDLFRFQQVWKEEGEGVLPEADQDGDRTIGASDLVILLHAWGNVTGP